MGNVGGDLATLRNLHKVLQSHAKEALEFKRAIDSSVDSAVWEGTNANKFRHAWADYRKTFDNLHNDLTNAETDVKNQHNNLAAATGESDRI